MSEIKITPQIVAEHGITPEEHQRIEKILGRTPNYTELGIFSVMWSEHCSYKNSRPLLRRFPTTGPTVLQGPGENAGIVDIGDGLAVVMKVESHNHPSAIEPYQGAATGVGGILRDIFTMGARPVALLNSLRFGPLTIPRNRYLFERVVKGIGDYGNCMGIPTVGGEVYFDDCYTANPLVNAMCVGIIKHEDIVLGVARDPGTRVFLIGSTTGRDGIHGATFASEEISEQSESQRSAVQVGDPFTEKSLLEATLELIRKGYLSGIQDMGAAGLTCSTCEMSSKGGVGMKIDLDLVPKREAGMSAYEILLSESQERMLLVAIPGCEEQIAEVCEKWELVCAEVGVVTDDGMARIMQGDKEVACVPSRQLADEAPIYTRTGVRPAYLDETENFDTSTCPMPADYDQTLLQLMGSPNLSSRKWVYQQYDHTVRTDTVIGPGGDAAVIRIKGLDKAIAVVTDCNSRYCYLSPKEGGKAAVAEAARNLVVTGARPLAVTDCLNFGNPEKLDIYYQLSEVIDGLAESCRALETPVISGNVSLYNQSEAGSAVFPTPVIGMVGLVGSLKDITTPWFKQAGDHILLLGESAGHLGGSEYLLQSVGKITGQAPKVDLKHEKILQKTCLELIRAGLLASAHDLSEGGLAVAVAEAAFGSNRDDNSAGPIGAQIKLLGNARADGLLFGEDQGRILISCTAANLAAVESRLTGVLPYSVLGKTGGPRLVIEGYIDLEVAQIKEVWQNGLVPPALE